MDRIEVLVLVPTSRPSTHVRVRNGLAMDEVGQKVYVRDEEHEWLPADVLDRTDEGNHDSDARRRTASACLRFAAASG